MLIMYVIHLHIEMSRIMEKIMPREENGRHTQRVAAAKESVVLQERGKWGSESGGVGRRERWSGAAIVAG